MPVATLRGDSGALMVRRRFLAAARAAGLLDPGQPPADDQAIPE
jgi:hypothetical protein